MQQSRPLTLFAILVVFSLTGAAPPPPAVYDAQVHYSITGLGNQRIGQYFALTDYLKKSGFTRTDEPDETEPEDPRNLPFNGTVPSAKARLLLADPRVQVIRLLPQGKKLADDKAALVRVHLELPTGYGAERQRLLTEQLRKVLKEIGFQEGAVYDHQGNTRLVGALPVGSIDTVLKDLRKHPAAEQLGPPFRSGPPVRVVEVLPDMPLPSPHPVTPLPPPELEKLSPELRQLVADKEKAKEPLRYEVILALTPDAGSRDWLRPFRAAAGETAVEGRLGQLVTVHGPRGDVVPLAARPEVAGLRLPRPARPLFPPGDGEAEPAALARSGPVSLTVTRRMTQVERAAVVDGDFRGWEALREAFPRATIRFVDLTRQRNRELRMEPYSVSGPGPGQGTRFARMLLRVAPEAEVLLVCVDPASPYQLETAARALYGDPHASFALERRLEDLTEWRAELDAKRAELLAERTRVFEDFRVEGEAEENRKKYRKRQADHDCDEASYRAALARYVQLTKDLRELRGVGLVLSGLEWHDGHPAGGASALTHYFDDRIPTPPTPFAGPRNEPVWLQYTPDARDQAWEGLFRDIDRNEVMEFAPPDAPLPAGRRSKEVNFLAWRPLKGGQVADLPENALVRVTLQWRESHEPDLLRTGEDPYREPLANLRLSLVRQPDPEGAKQPDDEMEIVAESVGQPQRLAKSLTGGVYEHSVVFRVPKAGRYAVRVTGRAPNDTRPPGIPSLPAVKRSFDLRPRLFVQTLEGDGRAVLADYSTAEGTLGTPADSRRVERVRP
jgi:hypothetical protein